MDELMRSLGLLPKRKPRPKPTSASPPAPPQSVSVAEDVFETRPAGLFTMADLRRIDSTGSGTVSDRLKHLFGGTGSISDREKSFLASKGFSTGSRSDKWRKYLGVTGPAKLGDAIRKLSSLP